jgi:putative spermidine/putrescine transport system permease protein
MATDSLARPTASAPPRRRVGLRRLGAGDYLGAVPYVAYCVAFMVLPALYLVIASFADKDGHFTLNNWGIVARPLYLRSLQNSLLLALSTALSGMILGTLLAFPLARLADGLPRRGFLTLANVTANFHGIPLAFAFVATLGTTGMLTLALKQIGISIYPTFNLYSWAGLTLAYLYFHVPLMTLLVLPALRGLRHEWLEAAHTLGASNLQFWRYVGLPVLKPALVAGFVLLFASSMGAFATAYGLTQGSQNLLPIQIAVQISGEVVFDPGGANALGTFMVIIMSACLVVYRAMTQRLSRWVQ